MCGQPTAFQTNLFLSVNRTNVTIIGSAVNLTNISDRIALDNKPIFVKAVCSDGSTHLSFIQTDPEGTAIYDLSSLSSCSNCTIVYFIFCPNTENDTVLRDCLNVNNTVTLPALGGSALYTLNYTSDVKSYRYCPPTSADMPKEACMLIMLMFGILGGAIYLSGSSPFRFFTVPRMRMPKTQMYQVKPQSMSFTMMSVSSIAGKAVGGLVKLAGKGLKKLGVGKKGDKATKKEAAADQPEQYKPKTIFGKVLQNYSGFVGMVNMATKGTIGKIDITGGGRSKVDSNRLAALGMAAFAQEGGINFGGKAFSGDVTKISEKIIAMIIAMIKKILGMLLMALLPRLLAFCPLTAGIAGSLEGTSDFLEGVSSFFRSVGLGKAADFIDKNMVSKIRGIFRLWGLLDKLEDLCLGIETRKGMKWLEEIAKGVELPEEIQKKLKNGEALSDNDLEEINKKIEDKGYKMDMKDGYFIIQHRNSKGKWKTVKLAKEDFSRMLRIMPDDMRDALQPLIESMIVMLDKGAFLDKFDAKNIGKMKEWIDNFSEKYNNAKTDKNKEKVLNEFKKKLRALGLNADDPTSMGFEFAELAVKAVMGEKDQNGKQITSDTVINAIENAKQSLNLNTPIVAILFGNALNAAQEVKELGLGHQYSAAEVERKIDNAKEAIEKLKKEIELQTDIIDKIKNSDDMIDFAIALRIREKIEELESKKEAHTLSDDEKKELEKYEKMLAGNKFKDYSIDDLKGMEKIVKEKFSDGLQLADSIAGAIIDKNIGVKPEFSDSEITQLKNKLSSMTKEIRKNDVFEYGLTDKREEINMYKKDIKDAEKFAKGRRNGEKFANTFKIESPTAPPITVNFDEYIDKLKKDKAEALATGDSAKAQEIETKIKNAYSEKAKQLQDRYAKLLSKLGKAEGAKQLKICGELSALEEAMYSLQQDGTTNYYENKIEELKQQMIDSQSKGDIGTYLQTQIDIRKLEDEMDKTLGGPNNYVDMQKYRINAITTTIGQYDASLFGVSIIRALDTSSKERSQLLEQKGRLVQNKTLIKQQLDNIKQLKQVMYDTPFAQEKIKQLDMEEKELTKQLKDIDSKIDKIDIKISAIDSKGSTAAVAWANSSYMLSTYELTKHSPMEDYSKEEKINVLKTGAFTDTFNSYSQIYNQTANDPLLSQTYANYIGYMTTENFIDYSERLKDSAKWVNEQTQKIEKVNKEFNTEKEDILKSAQEIASKQKEVITTTANIPWGRIEQQRETIENLKTQRDELAQQNKEIRERLDTIQTEKEKLVFMIATSPQPQKIRDKIDKLKKEEQDLQKQWEDNDSEIDRIDIEINAINTKINDATEPLNKLEKEIRNAQTDLSKKVTTIDVEVNESLFENEVWYATEIVEAVEYKSKSEEKIFSNIITPGVTTQYRKIGDEIRKIRDNFESVKENGGGAISADISSKLATTIITADKAYSQTISAIYLNEHPTGSMLEVLGIKNVRSKEKWFKNFNKSAKRISLGIKNTLQNILDSNVASNTINLEEGLAQNKELNKKLEDAQAHGDETEVEQLETKIKEVDAQNQSILTELNSTLRGEGSQLERLTNINIESKILVNSTKSPASSWREWNEIREGWIRGAPRLDTETVKRKNETTDEHDKPVAKGKNGKQSSSSDKG